MKTTTKITMILGAAALLLLPLSGTARADETMRRLKTGEILGMKKFETASTT